MEEIIKLDSRYGSNYLKKMKRADDSESKTYSLKTDGGFLRSGLVDATHKFIDPPGGPMIVEGHLLKEANAKVKSIDYIKGFGYTITFE